jgi:surface protein
MSVILNYTLPTNGLVVDVYLETSVGITIDWGDLTTPTTVPDGTSTQTHTYTSSGTYIITISGTSLQLLGNISAVTGIQYLTSVGSFGNLGITSFKFIGASTLTSVPSTLPSSVTSMSQMFQSATTFNQDISGWNVSNVTNMSLMFEGASAFNNGGVALTWTTGTGTSNVTTMENMFVNASSFNQNVSTWNTSNVTNMASMFFGTTVFNNGGGNAPLTWNTGNVTTMFQMFVAPAFNQDVSSFNLSKIQNMTSMFQGATSFNNGGVALAWTTIGTSPSTVNMTSMFNGAPAFNQNISTWNMSNVTNMTSMFDTASSFNQDVSNWNMTNITNMGYMFNSASAFNNGGVPLTWSTIGTAPNTVIANGVFQFASVFNQDISSWDMSNVTNISVMFNRAYAFNNGGVPLTWTTIGTAPNTVSMEGMFYNATGFNQNISSWNMSNVTNMNEMFINASSFNNGGVALAWTTIGTAPNTVNMSSVFNGASAFNQNIGGWNVSNVTNMSAMLNNSGLNTTNFDNLLNGWAAQTVKPNVALGAAGLKYSSVGQAGYTTLTNPAGYNWTISGASFVTYTPTQVNSGYSFTLNFSYSGFTIVTGNVYRLTNNASPSVILSTYTANPGDTSLTFNNVVLYPGGINTLTITNQTTSTTIYNDIQINVSIVCFKEDSKILCFKNNQEQYIPIQNLRKGDLVKTRLNGYVPINMIGKTEMHNRSSQERIKDQLYKCSQDKYPEVFEDLVITGCHSILVDKFKDEKEREETIKINNGRCFVTDKKYRLPACVDERATVYEKEGLFTIYHLALDHDDYYMNYGIYANGLLVETCSKRYLKELSKMELIE